MRHDSNDDLDQRLLQPAGPLGADSHRALGGACGEAAEEADNAGGKVADVLWMKKSGNGKGIYIRYLR